MSKNTINTSEWIKKILPYILATGGILAVVIAGSIGKMNASSSISLDSMVTGTSEVSVDTMTELYTVLKKYAVYDNGSATGEPFDVGYVTTTDIGNDIDFVVIPVNNDKISLNRISGCKKLKEVVVFGKDTIIEDDAFKFTSLGLEIVAPKDSLASKFAERTGEKFKELK